jgi:hypothetical protein
MQIKLELEGKILVCIDDECYDKSAITYGKQYVLDETYTDNQYSPTKMQYYLQKTCVVIDNHNRRASLNRDRFVTLEEWRDKQINKII